jgi:ribosomal protein L7/L12
MAAVQIDGWSEGFKKASHTNALQTMAGLSLSEAKAATDAVLERKMTVISMGTEGEAVDLAEHLRSLGAIVKVVS